MKNFAGRNDADAEIEAELVAAGITVERLPEVLRERMGEVKTIIVGWLHGWRFERSWRYWIAKGPGIPPIYAEDLHRSHGKEVRVDGNCTCPSPMEWLRGFAVGLYHVDSQEGLNALAQTIRRVVEDAAQNESAYPYQPTVDDVDRRCLDLMEGDLGCDRTAGAIRQQLVSEFGAELVEQARAKHSG